MSICKHYTEGEGRGGGGSDELFMLLVNSNCVW